MLVVKTVGDSNSSSNNNKKWATCTMVCNVDKVYQCMLYQSQYTCIYVFVSPIPLLFLLGYYPYPELVRVLYNIHTGTQTFCEFFTTLIPVPETFVSSVRPCNNTRRTGTTSVELPGTSVSSARLAYRTRNFCEFCTFIPDAKLLQVP